MHENRNIKLAKDFLAIENNDGALMFVILHNEDTGEANSDAKILYGDKGPHSLLIKNDDHAVVLDFIDKETFQSMQNKEEAIITEIEYNEELIRYNLENDFDKSNLYKLFEFAEAKHAIKEVYTVSMEKIENFDERFQEFINNELKEGHFNK